MIDHASISASETEALHHYLFASGQQLARGEQPERHPHGVPVEVPDDKQALAHSLLRGMALGRDSLPASEWCRLAAAVESFLAQLTASLAAPGLDHSLTKAAERLVAKQTAGDNDLTRTVGRPLNLHVLTTGTHVSERVDSMMFHVPFTNRYLEIPLVTSPTGQDVRYLAWSVVKQKLDARLLDAEQWWPVTARVYRARALVMRGMSKLHLKKRARETRAEALATMRHLTQQVRQEVAAMNLPVAPAPSEVPGEPGVGEGSQETWDAFFERENPWKYDAGYEQLKYQRTLSLLKDEKLGRVLEIACAEGHFTVQLAPHVGSLVATDISSKALRRAQQRCGDAPNVEFRLLDAYRQPLPSGMDAIVCSEVLYYMDDESQLHGLVERIADALHVGGVFVHAHAFDVCDDPSKTGFDWGVSFAAKTISAAFGASPRLRRVKRIETELYIVESYRRVEPDSQPMAATADATCNVESVPVGAPLEPGVAGSIIWNGVVASRAELEESVRAYDLPVLMYHRVHDAGPESLRPWRVTAREFERQLRFLKRRGFYSVSPAEWQRAAQRSGSLRGRPILLTFDDAYSDFYEVAWPILRRNGFSAHVFVVTDRAGEHADWDAHHGEPAPLMTWQQIATLAGSDSVTFGSHLATHTSPDGLPTPKLLAEAVRSKIMLERVTARPVDTVATPFGVWDPNIATTLSLAGYRRLFTIDEARAPVVGCEMVTPRIGVFGNDDINDFAAKLDLLEGEPPSPEDEPTEL